MKIFKLSIILFLLNSCNVSTLSEKEVNDISNLKVRINIEDGNKKNSLNKIMVLLSDGKKQIINDDIKIHLNGKPLELFVRQGNYYDKHSYYSTDDLLRCESYYFEITLPDSNTYPIAYIKPNKIPTEFNFPNIISVDEDFILKWTNLNTPFEFKYIKGLIKERRADNVTEYSYDGRHTDTLTAKTGEYIIPKSYFIDSNKRTTRIETTLTTEETGLTNPNLRKKSCVKFSYKLEKTVYRDKNE